MMIREFNERGLSLYEQVMRGEQAERFLRADDASFSNPADGLGSLPPVSTETAKQVAQAVIDGFGEQNPLDYLDRPGLWAWLTYALRDTVFKRTRNGFLKVGEYWRWYPANPADWQKGQRHLIRMPVLLLASLGENSDHLLCGAPHILPEIREQLTSQKAMFDPGFQAMARHLYFDKNTGRLKRGAGGKSGGSARRLAVFRKQLEVTWELDSLPSDVLLTKVPKEFDRFLDRH